MKKIDLTGKKFGKWTAINRGTKSYWLCKCECGTEKLVYGPTLKNGTSTNCGCVQRKHGFEGTKIYRLWAHMKERCEREKHKSYSDYGGRGIKVCEEWQEAKTFIDWALSNGYKEDLTLDRIDTNGNYEPNNCRFVTNLEQQNNKRNNRFVEINGKKKTLAEWARVAKISPKALRHRVEAGWNENDLLKPVIKYKKKGGG